MSARKATGAATRERSVNLKTVRGHVTQWTNHPTESLPGACVVLRTESLGAWGHSSEKAALEALALKLEALAAEVLALAK